MKIKNTFGNKGMYTEALVNKTIDWYKENKIAIFRKSFVPIAFQEDANFFISGTADIDYYGIYQGKYISFEVKETSKNYFLISNIKKHQIETLKEIFFHKGISFLLLNFLNGENEIWIIFYSQIKKLIEKKIKQIKMSDVSKYGICVPVEYPGIVDWIKNLFKK